MIASKYFANKSGKVIHTRKVSTAFILHPSEQSCEVDQADKGPKRPPDAVHRSRPQISQVQHTVHPISRVK